MHHMEQLAYSYIRFSSLGQSGGDSVRRQEEKFTAYCQRKGIKPAADKFQDKGRSGWKGEHLGDTGELRRFLRLVESGDIPPGSVLVVESLDRLGRQEVEEAFGVFSGILGAGIKIVTLGDGEGAREYVKGGGMVPLIMSILEMSRAYAESQRKSELIGAAMANKQAMARASMAPMGNVCPLWLRLKPGWRSHAEDGSAYEEIPERADVVRLIFKWAIEGVPAVRGADTERRCYGKEFIAKKLNELGHKTFRDENEKLEANRAEKIEKAKKEGKPVKESWLAVGWGASSVDKILKNPAVFGTYQPRTVQGMPKGTKRSKRPDAGDPIAGYFPAVVSPATFYEAQAEIDKRRTYKSTKQSAMGNVWQGIGKCEKCGSSMQLVNKGAPPKGGRYLRCGNTRKGVCKSKTVRFEHAEEVFRGMLLRLDALALVKDESAQLEKALRAAEGHHVAISRKLEALALRLDEAPDSPTIAKAIDRAEGELSKAAAEVERLKRELAAENGIGWEEFLRRLDLSSFEGRMKANALMKRLGVLVTIGPSGYGITQNGKALFGMDYREGEGAGYWSPGFGGALPSFLPVADIPTMDASEYRDDAREGEGQPAGEY